MTTTTSVPSESNSSKQEPKINNNTNCIPNSDSNNNNTINTSSSSNTINTSSNTTTTNVNMIETTSSTNCVAPADAAANVAISNASPITTSINNTPPNQRALTITPIINPSLRTDEDFNIRFVNLVRNHKCLYDKKVPEYRNRDNQEKAWLQISMETKESVIHCKERWRNLRACLSRYIKQQSGSDPQHKPYYLTEHMAFLLPFLKSTRNSLDGNNSLATLFKYSQQQQQQQQHQHLNTQMSNPPALQVLAQPHFKFTQDQQQLLEVKCSLSDNGDEETIDAFDPAITASMQNKHPNQSSPAPSDTASANTLQNFIPDIQLSELRTLDGGVHELNYQNSNMRRHSHDFDHEPKRIKTECHANETVTTNGQLQHMYAGEQADMEFFRSILPDIAGLSAQQKRKFKIGILELIDDVVARFPHESSTNGNVTSQSLNTAKTRRTSSREWRN